ncbi:hypothetical protein [Algoriphagus aquimarinus]|uniref:Uncharacterized protein n=1 Tax=Algoriphagus aquimarinus TaxID=237018 RepID=A0A1I1C338_9BACT|nr:hypothetical protein [Algoriphagus aquimarinus]SFB56777.1 hypothetical protein SAMN04489723_12143 [Algoriphagus aquimarinus]
MRVVKEFIQEDIRISMFSWNNKYILKYELGPMEQTFKIPETDVLAEEDLEIFWTGDFFEKVKARFKEMGQSFRAEVENL